MGRQVKEFEDLEVLYLKTYQPDFRCKFGAPFRQMKMTEVLNAESNKKYKSLLPNGSLSIVR
jgi:hypothetical protein